MKLISYQPWRSLFMVLSCWMLAGVPRFFKIVQPLSQFKKGLLIVDITITFAWITILIIILTIMYKNVKTRQTNGY